MKKNLIVIICALLVALCVNGLAENQLAAAANEHYEKGLAAFIDGNYDTAMNHWIKAAEAGDEGVYFEMGWLLWFDEDGLSDHEQKAYWVEKATQAGYYDFDEEDILANWELGNYSHTGYLGTKINHEEAVFWYRRAAMGGNVASMKGLAEIYHDDKSVMHDIEEAAYWYQQAAEAGDVDSMYAIGRMYRSGEGVEQNEQQAVYWMMKAAEMDYANGLSYYNAKYFRRVQSYWEKAAQAGHVEAMYMLGQAYGLGEIANDIDLAIYWCQKAAESGHPDAKYMVEQMQDFYDKNPDIAPSVYWCQKAAETGHLNAMHSLGDMYYHGYYKGISVQKDLQQALYWYKKAAEAGCVELMQALGGMYYYGDAVEQDYDQAEYWFRKGAENGDGQMMCWLGILYYYGQGVEQDYDQAAYWFRTGADAGDKYAMQWLGEMYYYGQGVGQDKDQAWMWLNLAVENGNWDARTFVYEYLSEYINELQ